MICTGAPPTWPGLEVFNYWYRYQVHIYREWFKIWGLPPELLDQFYPDANPNS